MQRKAPTSGENLSPTSPDAALKQQQTPFEMSWRMKLFAIVAILGALSNLIHLRLAETESKSTTSNSEGLLSDTSNPLTDTEPTYSSKATSLRPNNPLISSINANTTKNDNISKSNEKIKSTQAEVEEKPCADEWDPAVPTIPGRCFGLSTSESKIDNAQDCERLCCETGKKCVTWQYWGNAKICKIGGDVRIGLEAAETVNWCEPLPPIEWKGRNLLKRQVNEDGGVGGGDKKATCTWGSEEQSFQCFGLGPERMLENKSRISSAEECGQHCCDSKHCILWQWHKDRGCFHNIDDKEKSYYCDKTGGNYHGGRKKVRVPTNDEYSGP